MVDDRQIRASQLTTGMPPPARRLGLDRLVKRRHRELVRAVGRDLLRVRLDTGASQRQIAALAGIDYSHFARIESGVANASLETLTAISVALGSDLAVRLYPGTGPRLTDRHQARMIEALLRILPSVWRAHVEVPVSRPARGVIDVVLERRDLPLFVAAEAPSAIHRLEQQVRWAADKARSLGSSELIGPGPEPATSTMLLLRATASTRELARQFEQTLRAAYPARAADAFASLRTGAPWPGSVIVWVRIEGDHVEVMDRPPRGVNVGR